LAHLPRASARDAVVCQKVITKATRRLFRNELTNLTACVQNLFACVQGGDARCADRAKAKCTKKLAQITDAENSFVRTATKRCTSLAIADVLSHPGLDYELLASECASAFNVPLVDQAAVSLCVAAKTVGTVARLATVAQPRAGELIDLAGLILPAGLDLVDFGGSGLGAADADVAKALVGCSAAITRRDVRLANTQLDELLKCGERTFTCVEREPDDSGCLTKAADVCSAALATLATEPPPRDRGVETNCSETALLFADLRAATGANLGALAPECAAVDVPALDSLADYERCLTRRYRCELEDLARFSVPRADEFLRFMIGQPLRSDICP
jgi:hypothetical protein